MAVVRSICGQCPVGCGIRAVTGEERELTVAGDTAHPANAGLLCARSERLGLMLPLEGRLLHPSISGRRVVWDKAVAHVARRLGEIIARHGPDSVAIHLSGELLTEDYYVANKLMKGFIGSAHVVMPWGGAGEAYRTTLGEDVVPGDFEDIERADILLLAGASTAARHPVLMDRVQAARHARGSRLVMLSSAESEAEADLYLRVTEGSEAALLRGLLVWMEEAGWLASGVATSPDFWAGQKVGHDLWSVARTCGLSPAEVRGFYDAFAGAGRVVTIHGAADGEGGGVSQAVLNLHLAAGWIGKAGAAPLILPDASNAMGAREVGCLPGEIAAHMGFGADMSARIARFWGARAMASGTGLQGAALAEAIGGGRIKALWSIGGALPEELRAVAGQLPLSIVSTPWADDVGDGQVALPSPVWIEKDGTVTAADRLISRQRMLFPLPGEAKPDWWIVTRVAQAMGWRDAFHYERPAEIYREHVRLTAYQNEGERLLNLRRHAPISNPAYDELTPWRWGEAPFDGGRFPTPDGRARLLF